jgi:hypothetical protein
MSDLIERLRAVEGRDAPGSTRWHRNPDGPEAAGLIERLRAAGEAALYQLVIINGAYATDVHPEHRAAKLAEGAKIEWRIDTTEAIAALKAVLPLPPVDVPAQPSQARPYMDWVEAGMPDPEPDADADEPPASEPSQAQQAGVTEAMVKAALSAWFGSIYQPEIAMREALTAALSARQGDGA